MQDGEWEDAARRAELPVVLHFAVCPHSPTRGVLLSENGSPVLTRYGEVDWKGLAASAREAIEGCVPKDVKLFIADDAVDLMEALNISTETGREFTGLDNFVSRLKSTLSRLSMQDMRSGITKLAGINPDIHMNPPIQGKRPPLGVLILSLKFSRFSQLIDYSCEATSALFGYPAIVADFEGFEPEPTTGEMPSFLAEWLRSQFGVVYGAECTTFVIAHTFSD